jgi:hypothetical protein
MYLYENYNYFEYLNYIDITCKEILSFKVITNSIFKYIYKQLTFKLIIMLIFVRCRSPDLLL